MWEMFGTGLSHGSKMVIEENGAFHFYIGIGVGGDGRHRFDEKGFTASVTPFEGQGKETMNYRLVMEESGHVKYLVMDYDGELLYWTKSDENFQNSETASTDGVSAMEKFIKIPWSEIAERNLTFQGDPIPIAPEIRCIGEIPEAQIKLYGYGDEEIQG